jgi:hypothetical protein
LTNPLNLNMVNWVLTLGIIRLANQYSSARVEAAEERALLTGACRYQSVKSILKNSLDVIPPSAPPPSSPPPPHDDIRGAEYFERGDDHAETTND